MERAKAAFLEAKEGEEAGQMMELQKKVEHLGRQLEKQSSHMHNVISRNGEILRRLGHDMHDRILQPSAASQLASLSQMLDASRITREEFDTFKATLL